MNYCAPTTVLCSCVSKAQFTSHPMSTLCPRGNLKKNKSRDMIKDGQYHFPKELYPATGHLADFHLHI